LVKEEFGYGNREILGAVPIENWDGGAAEEEMIRSDHLRSGKLVERANAKLIVAMVYLWEECCHSK